MRDINYKPPLINCPYCNAKAAMQEVEAVDLATSINDIDAAEVPVNRFHKLVACTNAGDEEMDIEPCPMYLPSHNFYRATMREAAGYWNHYPTLLKNLVKEEIAA